MIARDIANAYRRVEEMQRKELVKVGGKWEEQYVDSGPSRAIPRHGYGVHTRKAEGNKRGAPRTFERGRG